MSGTATAMLTGNPGGAAAPPAGDAPPQGTGAAAPPAAATGAPAPVAFAWDPALPKEVTDLLAAKTFDKNPNALATAYYQSNKVLSGAKDVIALPADDAPAEAWSKFNEARGVPKTAAEYDDFKFKEGAALDDEFKAFGKSFFHALGVPKGKAQAAIDMWQDFALKRIGALTETTRQTNENELKQLETTIGKEKWNANVVAGQAAFKALGLPADVMGKVEAAIGASAVLQLMSAIGSKIPKEAAVLGNGGGGAPVDPTQMTAAQLEETKAALMADKDFMEAYNKGDHPKHNEAVQRMLRINDNIVARRQPVR